MKSLKRRAGRSRRPERSRKSAVVSRKRGGRSTPADKAEAGKARWGLEVTETDEIKEYRSQAAD